MSQMHERGWGKNYIPCVSGPTYNYPEVTWVLRAPRRSWGRERCRVVLGGGSAIQPDPSATAESGQVCSLECPWYTVSKKKGFLALRHKVHNFLSREGTTQNRRPPGSQGFLEQLSGLASSTDRLTTLVSE
jgi:hypothetical protein